VHQRNPVTIDVHTTRRRLPFISRAQDPSPRSLCIAA
jgi:hypothetical protein